MRLIVFNMLGQEVLRLVDGTVEAGRHEVQFDGSQLPSGVYMYRIEMGAFTRSQLMNLLK